MKKFYENMLAKIGIPTHLKSTKNKVTKGVVIKASFAPKLSTNLSQRNSVKMMY